MMVKQQRISRLILILVWLILFGNTGYVFADDLDDISIQVIGLDELPDDTLERIPMPSPDFGNLSDIHHNILLNQSAATERPGSMDAAQPITTENPPENPAAQPQ